jgi:acyl carrier protein
MGLIIKAAVRQFVGELLRLREDRSTVADSEALFSSGRLDSLAAVEIVTFLEQQFAIDFSEIDFEIDLLDSIDAIVALGRKAATSESIEAG